MVAPSINLLACYYFPMIVAFFNESFLSNVLRLLLSFWITGQGACFSLGCSERKKLTG